MKTTKTKTTTETIKYKLHKNVILEEVIVDGKMQSRKLLYSGKKVKTEYGDSRDFWLVYDPDMSVLKKTNPCWRNKESEGWFEFVLPENPKDIDVNKIVFASCYDHTFWDINLEQIPVVVMGDYIDARISSRVYDLEKLHKHFSKHKQIVEISEIELVPWYNNDSGHEKCFSCLVLPTAKQLKEMKDSDEIFYRPWGEKDYLGMKKFYKGEDD